MRTYEEMFNRLDWDKRFADMNAYVNAEMSRVVHLAARHMEMDFPHIAVTIRRLFEEENIKVLSKRLGKNKIELKFSVTSDVHEDRLEANKMELNHNLPFRNALSA